MMPAKRVPGAVPVSPNPRAQPPHLGNQLLAHHRVEIFVHDTSLPSRQRTAAEACREALGAERLGGHRVKSSPDGSISATELTHERRPERVHSSYRGKIVNLARG
jgi:hypothetical protein